MKRGKIISVEGTSCVGKTTLCSNLEKLGWIVIPEAIRYLEKETQKKGDDASPIPNKQTEEYLAARGVTDYEITTPDKDAEYEKVYDFADLFTDKEEQELYSQITKYISSYKMDLAVVTINENNK